LTPIFEADNSQSSIDFTIVEEVSTGIVSGNENINSTSITTGKAIEKSVETSAELAVEYGAVSATAAVTMEASAASSLGSEFATEYSQQTEISKQKIVTTTFTAPAGSKFKVYQPTVSVSNSKDL
jgi:hypothetical protein